ncbi:MAG: cell surface protein SprA [Paludibacteraceae bacterium]|nr:cell surface protein SprA [Paludibacteraceae bacterium]
MVCASIYAAPRKDKTPADTAAWDSLSLKVKRIKTDTYEDLNQPQNNLDLQDPQNVQTTTEYDPVTGMYVIRTKIGDIDITTPISLNDKEYKAYSEQKLMHNYWQNKIAEGEHDNERKFDITDMKFNIGPADKVFGPGGVQLKTQGSAELIFAFKHQYVDNPVLTQKSRNNNILDFDEKIQLNVQGKVGEKLNLNMSYNTEASFAYDQQNIKLNYKGKEDDIIQSIEAGNVSMQLNSSLITGSSALFGIKTDLKFGKLKIQALVSQQNSTSQQVSSEGGAQLTKFEVDGANYDENRHFFLAQYFRDTYESNMSQLPYIASGITINRVEVWITNKRAHFDDARNIVAFMDLGEATTQNIDNQRWTPLARNPRPNNRANTLYDNVIARPEIRSIQTITSALSDLIGGEDYEKIESARRLSPSEYTLNSTLGYISLKTALNQDEVLAVAYEYTYGGQVYQVGEFSTDANPDLKAPNALILKLLKGTNNAPGHKTWDLMMKNVYYLGATQMSKDNFELYITYRDDSIGTDLQYLSESQIKGKQLLRVMNLDRLDSKNNPTPDGKFDYIEGYTAISSTGRIIFPVLEPFGSHLYDTIGDPAIANKYVFQELYDSTLIVAEEMSEKNKFTLTGKYKATSSSEIRLNAMNIPRGSVTVTAGGAKLTENVDYTVDYTMGTVTILNTSILESGTKVDVQLENQSTFSMQRKTLVGTHLEYQFNKDFLIGGTIMHMSERPLTTKVNTGSEPISNTIWGLNLSYKKEFMWLTNALDALPWTTATQPSSFQINAEFAQLIPGHTRDVSKEGYAYIDDFEATKTSIDIHYPYYWYLASTPSRFEESTKANQIAYNKNRAHIAWYTIDPILAYPQTNTPLHLRNDLNQLSDHRIRIVQQTEIYPNRSITGTENTRLAVLNLAYYPEERGSYNISASEYGIDGKLTNPRQRWGGIMRKLDNTDFERSNIEYIEFWLMDPALTNPNGADGYLYIDLGDVSEDILKDGKKSFEHGLPASGTYLGNNTIDSTMWGIVPKTTSTVTAFSNEAGARARQDVGLNGLSTQEEYTFSYNGNRPYGNFVDSLRNIVDNNVLAQWTQDPFSPLNDPAGDNYHFYRGSDFDQQETSVLNRYKHYNGTEGNSPDTDNSGESYGTSSTLQPDIEDINNDNTLNEYEKYYEYEIRIQAGNMQVGQGYITDKLTARVTLENGETQDVNWYQFKIPIRNGQKIGSIRNFKSIRFMRMYMTGFEHETFLRFGTLQLVRGEWRTYNKDLHNPNYPAPTTGSLEAQAVNIEENASRTPVNYVLPPGISRQTDPGQAQLIAQNEQAMVLRVRELEPGDAKGVYKNMAYDMRNYKKLQMFVHAEQLENEELNDNELACFIRLGSDMKNNYYEYEIPLKLTPQGIYNNDSEDDRRKVWLPENMFDLEFKVLTNAKMQRNKDKRAGNAQVSNAIPYEIFDDASGKPQNKITVVGNPTLGEIEYIMIGIRNKASGTGVARRSGEVWVNELRLSQFNEDGGVAAMANMSLALSDIGQVNVAGRLETDGYGSIESNVLTRNMENNYQLSVSAAFEAGRLFPEKAKIQLPLYVAYTNQTSKPKYNPLDTDVELKDALEQLETKEEKDSLNQLSRVMNTSTNFTVNNAKVNIKSKKRPMFYDPANFSISYALANTNEQTPEQEKNETRIQRGSFNYAYNFNPKPWEPFKDIKQVDNIKIIKEFNLYYLPQSWAFTTDMSRTFTQLKLRDFSGQRALNDELSFSKDWMWNRKFDFKYDLTKNLKFSLQTAMNSTVDEAYYTPEIIRDYNFTNDYYEAWKDTVLRSLAHMGAPYTYQQVFTAQWNVPINKIPGLDWITANGSYNATYGWNRTATTTNNQTKLGNVINSLATWQVDGQVNFETLYNKSKYLQDINSRYSGRPQRKSRFREKTFTQTVTLSPNNKQSIMHNLGSELINVTATDSTGKKINIKFKSLSANEAEISCKDSIENVLLTFTTKDPSERTAGQKAADLTIRFLMMFRKGSITYRSSNGMTIPGFYPEAGFMGQRKVENMYAPGYDFAFGFIPNNFLEKAKRQGWLSGDTSVVQPATRTKTSDFDYKVTLEPFPGFKISVNGKRYDASSSSIIYTYDYLQETFTGSYNISAISIATAFDRIGNADNNYTTKSYERFLSYIETSQQRVQAQYDHTTYPDVAWVPSNLRGQKYDRSKSGVVPTNSADVLIPAFYAAYMGRDINKVSLNPFLGMLRILPNWSISYDGLSKLPWIKDHFKSVNLTHAYTSKYAIGSYTSYSTWAGPDSNNKQIGFRRDVTNDVPIPSSAYDISNISITESFSPLIGLNMTMKNSMTAKFEYRKQRNLALNITSVQLTEGSTNEFVIGLGYTVKDLNLILKLKNNAKKKVSNDLKLTVDLSYKDIKTLLRKVEENITQASNGNKVFAIKIAADYVLSSKINLQLFYDHQSTTPFISTSYPIKSDNVGINIKLMLTR